MVAPGPVPAGTAHADERTLKARSGTVGVVLMSRIALPVGLVALLVLACAPPAQAAFHGSKWAATGVATDAANNVYTMTLSWSGFCLSTWTLVIKDVASGATVFQTSFGGYEAQQGQTFSYMPELLYGTGHAYDPRIPFASTMIQLGTVSPSPTYTVQVVEGTYGPYTFAGVVPAEHWSFC